MATLDEAQSTSGYPNSMTIGQVRNLSKCDYCSAIDVNLQPCLFCGTVAYCSTEHQQFNWKKHKMICKTLQARGLVNSNLLQLHEATVKDTEQPSSSTDPHPSFSIKQEDVETTSFCGSSNSAFKPYRPSNVTVTNSTSSESVTSSSTGLSTLTINKKTVPVKIISPPDSTTQKCCGGAEKIIPTDDPDIQIIENAESDCKPSLRNRKRPTPSNSAELKYKDHNKNVVYSTTPQEHQRHLQQRGLAVNLHQAVTIRMRVRLRVRVHPNRLLLKSFHHFIFHFFLGSAHRPSNSNALSALFHAYPLSKHNDFQYIAEHVIRSLNEFGWAVVDNFLGTQQSKYTSMEIERLYKRGLFSAGQLMEGKNKDEFHIKDIRSDQIYWFDGVDERSRDAATVRLLICMIDSVVQNLKNRIDHDIGGRSRAMLAIYPGNGTRYVKHVDNPVKDGRCITTIYYCNENWDMQKDGGTLRLYPETSLTPMDIDPRADRLVFFWSDRRNPHEVMPVYRHRFAITIWYMDKNERNKSLAKTGDQTTKKANSPVRQKTSSQELSALPLRVFPSTSSDPTLTSQPVKIEERHHDSDSGVSLDTQAHRLERAGSLQSVSDAFKSGRSDERRSSTSSDVDFDDNLPPPPSDNPEYMI